MGCGASTRKRQIAPAIVESPAPVATSNLNSAAAETHPRIKGRPSLNELRKLNRFDTCELGGQRRKFGRDASQRPTMRSGESCLNILEKNSLLVAVRVRPLNRSPQSTGCLECPSSSSILLNHKRECRSNFTFDCVFDVDAKQQDIFDRTGRPLLYKAFQGYNGCLLAFGQTGSGKTYTMQGGSGEDAGVIPLLCKELFREVEATAKEQCISVSCSMLEIYNEQLNDLLAPGDRKDLHIHEDSSGSGRGIYVEGLSEHIVQSSEVVLRLLAEGQARRMVGQTNMNEKSSRSHSILTLHIAVSAIEDKDGLSRTVAKLHLVDLAGSERQKATGAAGDRLKEGAQINLSLSALGNVITALTESSGKRRHIPYRDSKLTRFLQDSLGGNSCTALICNVSPAALNADETLSTLRFADRAKHMQNVAVVNRDPNTAMLAILSEENQALKAKVARLEAHVKRLEENYE